MKVTLASAAMGLAFSLAMPAVSHAIVFVPPTSAAASLALADEDGDLLDDVTGDLAIDDLDWTMGTAVVEASVPGKLSSRAQTLLGTNRAEAIATLPSSPNGTALAMSIWYDRFTVTGGTGAGTASVSASVSGTIGAHPSAEGMYMLLQLTESQMTAIQAADPLELATQYLLTGVDPTTIVLIEGRDHTDSPSFIDGALTGSVGFNYGEAFYLVSALLVEAYEQGSISSFQSVEFGISTNDPTADLLTDSNVQYGAFVPEPGTYALMAIGAVIVGWAARRREV